MKIAVKAEESHLQNNITLNFQRLKVTIRLCQAEIEGYPIFLSFETIVLTFQH